MKMLHTTALAVVLGLGGTALSLPAQAADDAQKSRTETQESKAVPQQSDKTKDATRMGAYSGPCAPAFALVDENNDGRVSKKEAEFSRERAFKRIDADENGQISMTEYRECLTGDAKAASAGKTGGSKQAASAKAGGSGQSKAMEEYFGKVDVDKDQQVTREEYMQAAKESYSEESAGDSGTIGSDAYAQVPGKWRDWPWDPTAADLNQDRQISAGEAAADASRKFALLDDDGNGKVGKEEWFGRVLYDRVWLQERADLTFNAMDEDDNSKLSRKEFMKIGDERFQTASAEAGGDEMVPVWVYHRVYVW